MEQRTQNIINVIKNPSLMGCEAGDMENAVIRYMSKECACPIEYYTDDIIIGILKTAFADFISCCDNPEYYVKQLMNHIVPENFLLKPKSLKDSILLTLLLVQVRNNGKYINGFDDRINQLDSKHFVID